MITQVNVNKFSYDVIRLHNDIPSNLMMKAVGLVISHSDYIWVKKNDCLLRINVQHTSSNPCIAMMHHIEKEIFYEVTK